MAHTDSLFRPESRERPCFCLCTVLSGFCECFCLPRKCASPAPPRYHPPPSHPPLFCLAVCPVSSFGLPASSFASVQCIPDAGTRVSVGNKTRPVACLTSCAILPSVCLFFLGTPALPSLEPVRHDSVLHLLFLCPPPPAHLFVLTPLCQPGSLQMSLPPRDPP